MNVKSFYRYTINLKHDHNNDDTIWMITQITHSFIKSDK